MLNFATRSFEVRLHVQHTVEHPHPAATVQANGNWRQGYQFPSEGARILGVIL